MIYRHVFVRYIGRNVSLQDILLSWTPEVIKTLHLTTEPGTPPEPETAATVTADAAASAAANAAAAVKARWAAEASSTSTSTSPNATGTIANATPISVATATEVVDGSATAILRRLQARHDTLKAEYDLLVEAEAVQERTKTLERQIAAKKASLLG
jgi:hypothetical protein